MLLVQDSVAAETGDCAESRAAVNAQRLRLLEQPLVQRDMAMHAVFVHVEAQQRAGHDDVPQA